MLIWQAGKLCYGSIKALIEVTFPSPTNPSELQLASITFQISTCFLAAIFIHVLKMAALGTSDQIFHVTRKIKMKQNNENLSPRNFKCDSFEYFKIL